MSGAAAIRRDQGTNLKKRVSTCSISGKIAQLEFREDNLGRFYIERVQGGNDEGERVKN